MTFLFHLSILFSAYIIEKSYYANIAEVSHNVFYLTLFPMIFAFLLLYLNWSGVRCHVAWSV